MSFSDHEVADALATEAGELLCALRAEMAGADPADLRTEGDRRSQELIAQRLASRRPDDAVLSEEAADDGARLRSRRVWIVDPLDGTREYAEVGHTDWAVHVALWEDGSLTAGAVALPALGVTLSTLAAPTVAPAAIGARKPTMAVSRTRPPTGVEELSRRLGMDLLPMGSAGAKAMAVVRGEADAYVHAGGQYEWDSAAPVAVALAAGLHASRIDGSPLRYNQPDPRLPDLVICRPEMAGALLAAIADLLGTFDPAPTA